MRLSAAKHKKDDDATLEGDIELLENSTGFLVEIEKPSDLVVKGAKEANGVFDIE